MQTLLPAVVLTQFPISDQFGKQVDWQKFEKVPKVFVIGGQDAAKAGKDWGVFLQNKFNSGFTPVKDHLQTLDPRENIKIIALASLPDVPFIFKGLFRGGFRKESPQYGVALDFSSSLTHALGYDAKEPEPAIAVLPVGSETSSLTKGLLSSQEIQKSVVDNLSKILGDRMNASTASPPNSSGAR